MSQRRPLIRRTFLQERYEILIARQKEGRATFNELTELDDIVNRDPSIRKIVLIENNFIPGDQDNDEPENPPVNEAVKPVAQGWFARLKGLIHHVFNVHTSVIREKAVISI